jgi:hypothetical protein
MLINPEKLNNSKYHSHQSSINTGKLWLQTTCKNDRGVFASAAMWDKTHIADPICVSLSKENQGKFSHYTDIGSKLCQC